MQRKQATVKSAYVRTFRTLIDAGMAPGKALLLMQSAFALSPEQVVALDVAARHVA